MSQRGFTLIEIMIAVAIVAILVAVAIPNFMSYRTTAHARACWENMNIVKQACQAALVRTGKIVTDLDALSDNSKGNAFLKAKPHCPVGGSYTVSYDDETGDFTVTCSKAHEIDHNVNPSE